MVGVMTSRPKVLDLDHRAHLHLAMPLGGDRSTDLPLRERHLALHRIAGILLHRVILQKASDPEARRQETEL